MNQIRIFEPTNFTELSMARLLLQRAGIPFVVENENYYGSTGAGLTIGDKLIWITVPERFEAPARKLLMQGRAVSRDAGPLSGA